jgi:hypothetical protein
VIWATDRIFISSNNTEFFSRTRIPHLINHVYQVVKIISNPCIHQEVPNFHYPEGVDGDVVGDAGFLDYPIAPGEDPAGTVPANRYRTGFHHTVEEEDHRSFVVGRTLGSGSDRNHLGTVEEEGLGRSCIAAEEGRCRSCTPGEGVGSAAEERYNPGLRIGRWGPCLARRSVLLIQILVATAMSQLWIVEREKRAYHLAAHEILGRVQDTGSGLNVSSVFQVPIWNRVKINFE